MGYCEWYGYIEKGDQIMPKKQTSKHSVKEAESKAISDSDKLKYAAELKKYGIHNAADAQRFLQKAGILTKSGKLSPNYGGSK